MARRDQFGLQYNRRQFVSCVTGVSGLEGIKMQKTKREGYESHSLFGIGDDIAINSQVKK